MVSNNQFVKELWQEPPAKLKFWSRVDTVHERVEVHRISPHLSLRSKLSQAFLQYFLLILIYIIFKIYMTSQSLDERANDLSSNVILKCQSVERVSSALVSIPHHAVRAVESQLTHGVILAIETTSKTLQGLVRAASIALVWFFRAYTSFITCIIEFVIDGTVGVVSDVVWKIQILVNKALENVKSDLLSSVSSMNSGFDTLRNRFENILKVFDPNIHLPSIEIPDLSQVNIQIPGNWSENINQIVGQLPSLRDLENKTLEALLSPLTSLEQFIQQTVTAKDFAGISIPAPEAAQVHLCQKLDLGFIKSFTDSLKQILIWIIYLLIGFILLGGLMNMVRILFAHRKLQSRVANLRYQLQKVSSDHDLLDIYHTWNKPWLYRLQTALSKGISSFNRRSLLRWFVSYVTTPNMLILFSIGLISWLFIYLQLFIVQDRIVRYGIEDSMVKGMEDMEIKAVELVNNEILGDIKSYVESINDKVRNIEQEFNVKISSHILEATQGLNNTLELTIQDYNTVLGKFFLGTPIYQAIMKVMDCLVTQKIRMIQSGLTYIHDAANVTLPRLNSSMLPLDQEKTAKTIRSNEGENRKWVNVLIQRYIEALKKELPFVYFLIGVWVAMIIFGVIGVIWKSRYEKDSMTYL
ncbi:plasma membrane fusion protein prm1 [Basidiobolus ranarum]|uniref:Plasma membrane fusion protein PRM1 n=1 Tax=Basidiobolus ranarum TaxID=34480 RepID=A0ABR2WFG9_9FUNG